MSATTQKPICVIDAICNYYSNYNSNIHRAVHQLAEEATFEYEKTRKKVASFINARSTDEIIFTRNATEAINLISYSWARRHLKKFDRIVITEIEHHSNIVPWQMLAQEKGAQLEYIGVDDDGYLKIDDYLGFLRSDNVKLISVSQMSNVLGTIVPINEIVELAHQRGIPVMVDGSSICPSYAGGRSEDGLRLHGLFSAQNARADWCRRSLCKKGIIRRNGTFYRGRRHDKGSSQI